MDGVIDENELKISLEKNLIEVVSKLKNSMFKNVNKNPQTFS